MSPKSDYGLLKLASEGIVKHYCNEHNLEYTIVRPSAVYGPRDIVDRVVPKFLLQAANNETITVNGDSRVDFTHMDDFIKGMAQCVVNDNAANETFNITREKSRTLMEAAEVAIDVTGSKSKIKLMENNPAFGMRGTCLNTKARSFLGYSPSIDIEEGFADTWEWLKHKNYDTIHGS
jgi:nucleoside-diphosphate-sugar epimerase